VPADTTATTLPLLVHGTSHLAITVREELAERGIAIVDGRDGAGAIRAAIFCDDDDVANLAAALALRDEAPDARLVLRSFNTRLQQRLPELLGDCHVLSATQLAAPAFCDLAVGAGDHGDGTRGRGGLVRAFDRMRGSHPAAIGRQLWRRQLFRWSLALVVLLVLAQALLAAQVQELTALEALHAGLAGVLTLGFIDTGLAGPALAHEAAWVQLAAVATNLLDVVLFTVLLGLVADALVSERFARVFGGSARRLSGHVVIAGLGTVGYRILRELIQRGYRCAVIEADDQGAFVPAARALGAIVTIADVRQEEEFAQLGIDRAIAFIAVTDDDAANLEAAFTASTMAGDPTIVVRCFDPDLAVRLEQLPSITASRSVARLAAPAFVDAALRMSDRPED
jgi:voltage-gated potassium channel Kch